MPTGLALEYSPRPRAPAPWVLLGSICIVPFGVMLLAYGMIHKTKEFEYFIYCFPLAWYTYVWLADSPNLLGFTALAVLQWVLLGAAVDVVRALFRLYRNRKRLPPALPSA